MDHRHPIGHRDTDNVVRINGPPQRVNPFRQHPEPKRDPHRNLFESNLIEDKASAASASPSRCWARPRMTLRGNRVVDTTQHRSRTRIGLRIGAGISG